MIPLTTKDLNKILYENSVTKRFFVGTHPSCILPKTTKTFYSFITNTQNHDEFGEHWNAWIVDGKGLTFFDSFGRHPKDPTFPQHYRDFTRQFKRVKYVNTRVQGWNSKGCGYFCIHFIYLISVGFSTKIFLNDYSTDFKKNDEIVFDIVSSITL